MKTLVCIKPGHFEYEDRIVPVLKPGHAIIKIKRIGICGTDLHAYQGTQPYFNYPRILGHELSGDLIDADGADGFVPGEAVTVIPYFNCGHCIACRNGKPNCCSSIQVCGVHIDGGMNEYFSVPSYSLVHSRGLSYDELALIEPLAIGAHGVRRAAIHPNEYVLVVGGGPIGLGTMAFARAAGANVIAMDLNEWRLRFCKEKLGIEHVINPAKENVSDRLKEITNNDMPVVVIDATGSKRAIEQGIDWLAHGGRYVLIGLQKENISFSHPEFHKRESTLMSSRNATRADFEYVIGSIKKGLVKSDSFITQRVGFDEVKNSFESWLHGANGVIKPMVSF
jgi:2-desacetyl-2-hydroxyethyl bacteriochlorophyllide A dehydrogenase